MMISKLTLILIFPVAFLLTCAPQKELPDRIEFINNYNEAVKTASEKNQDLIVIFYKDDCPWCKMFDDSTLSDKLVIEMSSEMVFAKINAVDDSILTKNLGVSYYPTVIVAKSDGSEVDRLVGFYPAHDFFNEVHLYLQENETLEDYLERLKDDPERIDYLLVVGDKYRNKSNWELALEYYTSVVRIGHDDTYEYMQASFEIACIYEEMKEYTEAIKAYQEFVDRFPESNNFEDALRRIPCCYQKSGNYRQTGLRKQALKLYKEYYNKYPESKYTQWVVDRIKELDYEFEEEK